VRGICSPAYAKISKEKSLIPRSLLLGSSFIQNGKVVYISSENEDINNIETIYFQYAGK
jgi:hypothetical protein